MEGRLLRGCNNCSAVTFQKSIIKNPYAEIMILCSLVGDTLSGERPVSMLRGINLQEYSVSVHKTAVKS